ncbi:MAG: hypothetical protein HZB39_08900 [Planctomycetes bacterium]|nr:hypothetical protein [Planctomycetota bacterium]
MAVFPWVLAVFGLTSLVGAQADWRYVPLNGATPALYNAYEGAFDFLRGVLVVHVNRDAPPHGFSTWEWNGTSWADRSTANSPEYGPMAYDPSRGRVVKVETFHLGNRSWVVWEWDGSTWTRIAPVMPTPRGGFMLGYDPNLREVLMVGVCDAVTWPADNCWSWNGTRWAQRQSVPDPLGIGNPLLVTDHIRSRLLLAVAYHCVPNTGQSGTWQWDGNTWTMLAPPTQHTAWLGAAATYDGDRDRLVLVGGCLVGGPCNAETWEFDGTTWNLVPTANSLRPGGGYITGYDFANRRIVGWGGDVPALPSQRERRVFIYETAWKAMYDISGGGCAGSGGIPWVESERGGLPWIGDGFRLRVRGVAPGAASWMATGFSAQSWGSVTLPWALDVVGAPGCWLRVEPFVWFPCTPDGNGVPTWSITIPVATALAGLEFFNQVLVIDPGVNALGAVLSNAYRSVIGIR